MKKFPELLVDGSLARQERKVDVDREAKEEQSEKRIREEEKEGNETLIVKRRCVNSVSTEAFDILSQGEELESCRDSRFVG